MKQIVRVAGVTFGEFAPARGRGLKRVRRQRRVDSGSSRGTVVHMAADLDAPLDDFREYMQ